jgi:hypothetical protein
MQVNDKICKILKQIIPLTYYDVEQSADKFGFKGHSINISAIVRSNR